jgi:hypothetical protein
MLAFTSVYFSESGLFNGLQAIGIKNFGQFSLGLYSGIRASIAPAWQRLFVLRFTHNDPRRPAIEFAIADDHSVHFCFAQEIVDQLSQTKQLAQVSPIACQFGPGLGLTGPAPIRVVPSMSQIEAWPLVF